MNLLFFGPPGAGKGTQASLFVERKGTSHISTGNLFREAIKNQTPLGIKAKGFLDQGQLVPDSVTIDLVDEVLGKPHSKGFILDGFPRNVAQAEALNKILKKWSLNLDRAVFFKVEDDDVVKRMSGRRVCSQCGATYHIHSKPSVKEGICDNCGGAVVQRPDDREEVIQKRLAIYHDQTKPLLKYYKDAGKAVQIDALGEPEVVYERVLLSI